MINEQRKEKLKYFLESVNQISHQIAPEVAENVYDLGLIILENNSVISTEDIKNVFPSKCKVDVLEYNDDHYERPFIEKTAESIENKKWILIDLKKDPGHQLINQLKNLSNDNFIQLLDFKGKEIYNLKLPIESRLVVVVQRNLLEKQITHSNFLDIFGPVISLS